MLPAWTAPRPSVRDLGAHRAPDRRQAFTRPVREDVPRGLAAAGFRWRDHAIVTPLYCDDPRRLPAGNRSQAAHADGSRHGDRALTFTMDDLKRLPSVTRMHFVECAGNRHNGRQKNVQETHGMTSNAEWTGVLLSTLLKECGLKGSAKWFVAEGSEEVKGASSMPVAKAMDDCFVAYGMNGEAVRPQNGFPMRLMVPGFEGILHTKWVQRIKLVDRYYMNYNDFGHLDQDKKEAALSYQIGPKSVITYPSGAQRLPGKGFYEIRGLAWSGGGAIKQVEVSTDGGKKWNKAQFQGTPQRMAHCLFTYGWHWDGNETEIMSRCVDEIGQAQPTREQVAKHLNKTFDQTFSVPGNDNSVQPWKIAKDGSVTNGFA